MSAEGLISAIGTFLYLSIIGRSILSWFPNISYSHPAVQFIYIVTEPLMSPIRRVMPRTGMFDFVPMITIIIIFVVQQFLLTLVS